MASLEKDNQTSSSDIACTHCRDRKSRCDRKRPQCSNCKRDNAECRYQVAGKRVNHIKLLCNNVGSLDHRLVNIEGHISRLVAFLDKGPQDGGGVASPTSASPSSGSSNGSSASSQVAADAADRYHGPIPLNRLCQQFRESVNFSNLHCPGPSGPGEKELAIDSLLNRMNDLATVEHSLPQQRSGDLSQSSPKHYVMKAQAQFFEQVDYVTDVFVQDNFLANVHRVYASQIHQNDEPWVICFQTIILLVLGSELLGASSSSVIGGLASSFFLPSSAALVNVRLLMAPRLINVQALILLSVLAQQQDSQEQSELLFAQACTMAKAMGLHKAEAIPNGASAEEHQERWMVCRSLYLRDRGFTISRGSVSWFPEFNLGQVFGVDSDQHRAYNGRLDLASLQDKIYWLAHSPKPLRRSSKKVQGILTQIKQGLGDLARSHGLFNTQNQGSRSGPLLLDFLSTRISALQESPIPLHRKLVRSDARVSCLVLLLARDDCNQTAQEQYNRLISTSSDAYPPPSDEDTRLGELRVGGDALVQPNLERTSSLRLLSLLDTFPTLAFFILLQNVLWPSDEQDESLVAEDDLVLLQQVQACYAENVSLIPQSSYIHKVGSIFQLTLQVVNLLRDGQASIPIIPQPPTPSFPFPSTPESSQHMMDADMATFPPWPTPNSMHDLPWGIVPDLSVSDDVAAMLSFQH